MIVTEWISDLSDFFTDLGFDDNEATIILVAIGVAIVLWIVFIFYKCWRWRKEKKTGRSSQRHRPDKSSQDHHHGSDDSQPKSRRESSTPAGIAFVVPAPINKEGTTERKKRWSCFKPKPKDPVDDSIETGDANEEPNEPIAKEEPNDPTSPVSNDDTSTIKVEIKEAKNPRQERIQKEKARLLELGGYSVESACRPVIAQQKKALLSIKERMGGKVNWDSTIPLCSFDKVITNAIGIVQEIDLMSYDLQIDLADLAPLFGIYIKTIVLVNNKSLTGNLAIFRTCTGLEKLYVGRTLITGNVSELSSATALEHIFLNITAVTGDLSAFTNHKLKGLGLSETRVQGDIALIAGQSELTYLGLDRTLVSGNIENLKRMRGALRILINDSACEGDIYILQALKKLVVFGAENTGINGDISVMKYCTDLTQLYLANCHAISGDIKFIGNCKKIQNVDMANTSVTGDIFSLKDLKNLSVLTLQGCDVTGDTSSLPRTTIKMGSPIRILCTK